MSSRNMKYEITLHEAATDGRLSEIKLLVQNGADVLAKSNEYGDMPMHLSAINGHTDCVEYFLEQGVDVNASNDYGLTCAHHAAHKNHMETLKMLTKYGANIETRCKKNGNRPLEEAAYRGNFECVEYLIQSGSNLNLLGPQRRSVLYSAADGGHLKIIKFLVERGADLNVQKRKHGYSLIHCTAFKAHEDCLEYFLDLGIDVNLPNKHGVTPIMSAALGGHLNIIQFLVERGADLNVQEKKNGNHLIHSAAFGGDVGCLRYFLDMDIHIDLPNKRGVTPIMSATLGGHLNIIKFLVERGADLNVQENKNGYHLIHSAAFVDDVDCLRYFLDMDTDVDLPSKHGVTPTMIAAIWGHIKTIKLLILQGADINRTDRNRETALHFASRRGHYECVKCLIRHRASTEIRNNFYKTPHELAVENHHTTIADLLRI